MYDKVFENECGKIITYQDTHNMVSANFIVRLAIRISKKFPLLFLPTFIEDFISGMPSSQMIRKYELLNFNNHASIVKSLKLRTRQCTDSDLGGKVQNLQDSDQNTQYQFLTKYTNMLYGPLENLLNHNILQAVVSYSLLKHTYIGSENLQDYVMESYNAINKEISILTEKNRLTSFEKYLSDGLHIKIIDVVSNLNEQGHAIVQDGDISVTPEYPKFVEHVYDLLNNEKNGTRYITLQRRIFDKFPLVRLAVSGAQIFENTLNTLEYKNLLVWKKTFWKYSPSNDHLFTVENYNALMLPITKQRIESGKTKFFGRRVSPELFLDELKSLESGDLDDGDDQVTWLVGLVLSDSAMLQSPREDMQEFDFIVDLENYNFRPEQKKIMEKLDFAINSTIFHCKVMINDKVTRSTLSKLADALPEGEQGIIFTCEQVSRTMYETIKNDKTIQIIGEDAIRDWCMITPVTPCRKNSVARIRYGDNAGKTVLVKSLNYESGLATVETILDNIEILIPIGSIEEMLPNVSSLDDFEVISKKYMDFLRLLESLAPDSFENGLNTHIVEIYDDLLDLKKHTNPELFDKDSGVYFGTMSDTIKESQIMKKYILFENVYVEIPTSYSDRFKCTCKHLLNESTYHTLCPHLVAGIDHMCRTHEDGDAETLLKNITRLQAILHKFLFNNMKRSIEALSLVLNSEKYILKDYLQRNVNPVL